MNLSEMKDMPMNDAEPKPFRILSLDGGGIRGAFIAGFLADIESRLNCRLADYFDLIAGTSTGAIIAAALAFREPAAKIEEFYHKRGPKIFRRRKPLPLSWRDRILKPIVGLIAKKYGLDYDQFRQSKYAVEELRQALSEVFGQQKFEAASTRLVIPSFDLTRGQTVVFKTPHLPRMIRDRHYSVVDILLATTAAPTYFPSSTIQPGSAYIDGGIWANNPAMVAIAETSRIREICPRNGKESSISQDSIYMLSVGTGKSSGFLKPPVEGEGLMWWGPHVYNISSIAQSQGIDFQAQYFLGNRLHRIDYNLDGHWSLDSVDMLPQMAARGREACVDRLGDLRHIFFQEKAYHPYSPLPEVEPDASTKSLAGTSDDNQKVIEQCGQLT
jgi:uncharacterized protein